VIGISSFIANVLIFGIAAVLWMLALYILVTVVTNIAEKIGEYCG
tara:strand:+ start:91 stop:225 length:135 start_codon:yes stop_codon:yes gene_type:complete